METYDYKKPPSTRKKEEREKKEFSDYVKKEGKSYRRLTKAEAKKEVKKEEVVDSGLDDLLEFISDAIGGLLNLTLKIFPLVILFWLFTSAGVMDGVIAGFEAFLGDVFPGMFDGSFSSRIMIFAIIAMPVIILMSNRRYRRGLFW